MIRNVLLIWVCGLARLSLAEEPTDRLPRPDYHHQSCDPTWLVQVVQFHGHLGPSVVAGARMGMAGLRAVEAKGYFDVEVTCEGPLAKPPQACFLDGLQVATGATLGKRTLHWVQADRIAVRVKNTRTGKTVELRPTPALVDLLASFKSQSKTAAGQRADQQAADERLETVARKIALMSEKELVTATTTDAASPR
jgi:formylmethanofuran dehydrogenase subunit E